MTKNFYLFFLITISSILLQACYTKSDIMRRQLILDTYNTTTVITKDGEKYEFNGYLKKDLIKGDFIEGKTVNGKYRRIALGDVAKVNDQAYDTSTPPYLYAIGGVVLLSAAWLLMTR